jgi:hypothetical protein
MAEASGGSIWAKMKPKGRVRGFHAPLRKVRDFQIDGR